MLPLSTFRDLRCNGQILRFFPRHRPLGQVTGALDFFKCWVSGGVQDLGEQVVEKLLLVWLDLFLTVEEREDAVPMSRQ